MIKAVIFDLDGTLLDTIGDIAATHNMILGSLGLPQHEPVDFNSFIGSGIMEAIKRATPEGTPTETLLEINRRYQAHYPKHCTELTRPYEGMHETLKALAADGKRLAVLTNKVEQTAVYMINHFFPDIDFEFVWGNNGTRPLKPAPDAGFAACAALNIPPYEVAYVGDSDVDVFFSKASGFLPVGACWGCRGRDELEGAGAKLLSEKPLDILGLLNN